MKVERTETKKKEWDKEEEREKIQSDNNEVLIRNLPF